MDKAAIREMLPEHLALRRVLLVHIDETQHLVKETEKMVSLRDLANAIKDVVTTRSGRSPSSCRGCRRPSYLRGPTSRSTDAPATCCSRR